MFTAHLIYAYGAIAIGACLAIRHKRKRPPSEEEDKSGWIYFVAATEGPIKVGMSRYEPSAQRLPELRTMSPVPLRVMYRFRAEDRHQAETRIHALLKEARMHGEWFDRDATLALIDYLKEG